MQQYLYKTICRNDLSKKHCSMNWLPLDEFCDPLIGYDITLKSRELGNHCRRIRIHPHGYIQRCWEIRLQQRQAFEEFLILVQHFSHHLHHGRSIVLNSRLRLEVLRHCKSLEFWSFNVAWSRCVTQFSVRLYIVGVLSLLTDPGNSSPINVSGSCNPTSDCYWRLGSLLRKIIIA